MASGVLNTFREAGNALGVALFSGRIADGTVAGSQHAIILVGTSAPAGREHRVAGIRHGSIGVKDESADRHRGHCR